MTEAGKDPLVGSRIREYEILELIGKGGMGAVYRARHVYLDEERAIKVISARHATDRDFVERFIREAKILTRLRHPNLVQFHEFGTLGEDTFFMVMELIRGQSALERIRIQGKIPVGEAIKTICEAAAGLESAHQKGIIHRDISPDNLMIVSSEGAGEITKVLDFGIAKPLFESTQQFTTSNMFIGKPEYCSPEQCGSLREDETIDGRSDIYSLGITLYQMLSGKLPFHSKTGPGYLAKHLNEMPKPVSTILPEGVISKELDRVILKAISKKREDRQSSMAQLSIELQQCTETEIPHTDRIQPDLPASFLGLHPGEMFAHRYLIEKKIGQGGMGKVYKAVDKILEIPVALKIIEGFIETKSIERLKREVIVARKVAHANACRIYDMGESNGIHYVSMEFLEGVTLAERLSKDGRFKVNQGIPIMKQVLLALQEAHRVGVVHRDLKPENIMVDSHNRAHIMDFGISISADSGRLTQTGAMIGTPYYMAPEQFEGGNIDHRADIYAIGVILFQMFTGRVPFNAGSPVGIIFGHLKKEPPRPSSIVAELPSQLEKIILKALEKDADKRFQNVGELLEAIEPFAGSNPKRQAQELIREQKYSKAVKLLTLMLKSQPDNEEWKNLYGIARNEKSKRDLQRVKHLIHKKNLIQAQVLIEKIERFDPDTRRTAGQIRKLRTLLDRTRGQVVETYLTEAARCLELKDLDSAETSLESAWNLQPNNSRVAFLRETIREEREREKQQRLASEVESIRQIWAAGREEDAINRIESILEEASGFQPAVSLRNEISRAKAARDEREKAKQGIKEAFDFLRLLQFSKATESLSAMLAKTREQSLRVEISRMETWSTAMEESFSNADYVRVPELISEFRSLVDQDLLKNHEDVLVSLHRVSEERNAQAASAVQAQIDRTQDFFRRGNLKEAEESLNALRNYISTKSISAPLSADIDALDRRLKGQIRSEEVRAESIRRDLEEASQLYRRDAYGQALEKINRLLDRDPTMGDAVKLKGQIEEAILTQEKARESRELFDEGKKFFDDRRWQKAIECWERALRKRSDPSLQEWIGAARERKFREEEIKKEVPHLLSTCADLVSRKNFTEAGELIQKCRLMITSDYRLEDQKLEVDKAERLYLQELQKEESKRKKISKLLEETTRFFKREEYVKALDTVNQVLGQTPELADAIALQSEIVSRIEEKKQRDDLARKDSQQALPKTVTVSQISRTTIVLALSAIAIVLGVILWRFVMNPTPVPPPLVRVTINALPWARVKIIPVTNGITIPEIQDTERITPCRLYLPEAEYKVELQNDFSEAQVIPITVKSGGNNDFHFSMPAFKPEDAVKRLLEEESK